METRSPQVPKLSDLRESGSIEQDADVVMFLYREDREKPDTPNKNVIQVIVVQTQKRTTRNGQSIFQRRYHQLFVAREKTCFLNHFRNSLITLPPLPSVGPKMAERLVLYLWKYDQEKLDDFSETLENLKRNISFCKQCFNISENGLCAICQDKKRDRIHHLRR